MVNLPHTQPSLCTEGQGIMQKLTIVLVALATVFLHSEAKTFTRCQLVRELRKQRFPESQMRNWVCLIESESGRSTNRVNVNRNGSKDYGLFQINDQYWCSNTNKPGKDCNIRCSQLLTDNISVASTCAKKIYQRHKFEAWYGWKNKCKGKPLPDIRKC